MIGVVGMNTDKRGGYRENAQRPPLYDETMEKYFVDLPADMVEFLDSTGKRDRAQNLRNLIDWASDREDSLLFDPGVKGESVGRRYALRDEDVETAVRLGEGNRTSGIRRIIFTAVRHGVDLKALQEA